MKALKCLFCLGSLAMTLASSFCSLQAQNFNPPQILPVAELPSYMFPIYSSIAGPVISFPGGQSLYTDIGNLVPTTIHVAGISTKVCYFPDFIPNTSYLVFNSLSPNDFATGNHPTYAPSPYGGSLHDSSVAHSMFYVAIKMTFDSPNWTSLPANTALGLQFVNTLISTNPMVNASQFDDYFALPSLLPDALVKNFPHPLTPATVKFQYFYPVNAQRNLVSTDSFYTDANSAYFIYAVQDGSLYTFLGNDSMNHSLSLPFNVWPAKTFDTNIYNVLNPAMWAFPNPFANGFTNALANRPYWVWQF